MNAKIEKYLNHLFEGLNISDELKEELSLNLNDKYLDLVAEGMSEADAYKQVIAGIGDIEELAQSPHNINQNVEIHIEHAPNRNLKIGFAVFLFITSVLPLMILGVFAPGLEVIGVSAMFVMVALGVLILITIPKETAVNVDTKAKDKKEPTPKSKLMSSIHGLIWLCAVLAFFGLNMLGARFSWLVFIIAGLVIKLVEVLMNDTEESNLKETIIAIIWGAMVIAFFTIKFRYSWLFFILGAILTQLTNIYFEMKEAKHEQ